MPTIRPIERDDLPAVAELVRANLEGWSRDADGLARVLIDHPWAPDRVPALVAIDDAGELIGSIGAQARRVRFGDAELAGVSVSYLVVAADRRAGAAGVLMIRELLGGGQDLTWTDSGTPAVVRIWRALGGHLDHSRTGDWMLVLRPGRWLRDLAATRISRRHSADYRAAPVPALPFSSLPGRNRSIAAGANLGGADVSPRELAEHLGPVASGIKLHVAHDGGFLEAQFEYLASLGERVVCRLVRRDGQPIGWHAYVFRPISSRVLCIAAREDHAEDVLSDLVTDARRRGTAVISGRLEPHLDRAIRSRPAVIGLAQQPIVHARDPELLAAVASSASLLTELDLVDCEWW
jgi:hypothetical protein